MSCQLVLMVFLASVAQENTVEGRHRNHGA